MRSILAVLLLVLTGLAPTACSFWDSESEFEKANRLSAEHRYDEAIVILDRLIKADREGPDALEAARLGAKLAFLEVKDYPHALLFFEHLVLYSPDAGERLESQKRIAEIYFERTSEHDKAIIEFNKLLQLSLPKAEEMQIRMNLAKSLFYLNRFQESESELEIILDQEKTGPRAFEAKLLKGNIYFSTKQLSRAIALFKELMEKEPQRSQEEQVAVQLAISYEELNQFAEARAVLEKIRNTYPNPQFIDTKIKRLEQREKQLPGAHGLRK
jgi:tetratricopeptide (TPR) repeat protein